MDFLNKIVNTATSINSFITNTVKPIATSANTIATSLGLKKKKAQPGIAPQILPATPTGGINTNGTEVAAPNIPANPSAQGIMQNPMLLAGMALGIVLIIFLIVRK